MSMAFDTPSYNFFVMPSTCKDCLHPSSSHFVIRCGCSMDQPFWSPMHHSGEIDAYHSLFCTSCGNFCFRCSGPGGVQGPRYCYFRLNRKAYTVVTSCFGFVFLTIGFVFWRIHQYCL